MTNTGSNTGLRAVARTIGRLALTLGLALFVVTALLATRAQAGAQSQMTQPETTSERGASAAL